MASKEHRERVAFELGEAGVGGYGSLKFVSRYLPEVIHPDEHIEAVVYGRYKEAGGLLSFATGMLIATDKRVMFLDHKPGFTSMDELTYDVVSGVKKVSSGFGSSLTLHTRLGDYTIRFANAKGIDKFIHVIEKYRLEVNVKSEPKTTAAPGTQVIIDAAALKFMDTHEAGVISTIDRTGNVQGATIYYLVHDNKVYWATKASTQKARNIFVHPQVALTVFDAETAETVQLQGSCTLVTELDIRAAVLGTLIRPRNYNGEEHLPPVTTIHEDSYVVLEIAPTSARYIDYKNRS